MSETMTELMNPGTTTRDAAFPYAPGDWTSAEAESVARGDGIALTEDHWTTIKALQGYFATHERPNMRELHDALEEDMHSKGGLKYLYEIFPGGPVAQGCRFAGLEVPSGAADRSFGSVQ